MYSDLHARVFRQPVVHVPSRTPCGSRQLKPVFPGLKEIELQTGDGETLVAWYAKAKGATPTILYFHGNAGNAASRASKIETMHAYGSGVFYLNNRGYGGSSGSPNGSGQCGRRGQLAYDHLLSLGVPAEKIVRLWRVAWFRSGDPAWCAEAGPKAVVLEAPLTSTVDVGKTHLVSSCHSACS